MCRGGMLINAAKLGQLITLFIRDEKTGRHAFNPQALKALGVDPAVARELGHPLKDSRAVLRAQGFVFRSGSQKTNHPRAASPHTRHVA
jgi:hypothetical protein